MNKKFFFIATGITIFILILILVLSPKKNTKLVMPSVTPTPQPRFELADLSKDKKQQATSYLASITKKLPLSIASFPTSVGITTSINIYRLTDDETEIVRLEIYGLSYLNRDTNPKKNPNITAFKESYLKAMELLESKNIDPKKLIFIYGDKEYVRKTAQAWINALKLY